MPFAEVQLSVLLVSIPWINKHSMVIIGLRYQWFPLQEDMLKNDILHNGNCIFLKLRALFHSRSLAFTVIAHSFCSIIKTAHYLLFFCPVTRLVAIDFWVSVCKRVIRHCAAPFHAFLIIRLDNWKLSTRKRDFSICLPFLFSIHTALVEPHIALQKTQFKN